MRRSLNCCHFNYFIFKWYSPWCQVSCKFCLQIRDNAKRTEVWLNCQIYQKIEIIWEELEIITQLWWAVHNHIVQLRILTPVKRKCHICSDLVSCRVVGCAVIGCWPQYWAVFSQCPEAPTTQAFYILKAPNGFFHHLFWWPLVLVPHHHLL